MNHITTPSGFELREYQTGAIQKLTQCTKELIHNRLVRDDSAEFESALLVEMATGSGKTLTVGTIVDRLIRMRNKNAILRKQFDGLKIVLLTNRIDGVNQFRDDLIHGRTGKSYKPPILSPEVLDNIRVSTHHSKADKIKQNGEEFSDIDSIDVESFSKQNGRKKDELICSTFQTAQLKNLANDIDVIDIIIIDEAHNVTSLSDFRQVIDTFAIKGRNNHSPIIIPVTATPSNLTKELF